jgi:hypothetical protein
MVVPYKGLIRDYVNNNNNNNNNNNKKINKKKLILFIASNTQSNYLIFMTTFM